MQKIKIGIIGCGNISSIYLNNCKKFEMLDVMACADLDMERARAKAEEFSIPKACTVEELLDDPEIQIIVNLTVPKVHAEVSEAALRAGKHVYSEKPLAVSFADGKNVVELARSKGLRIGVAPDTVLGGGIQTCRKLIEDGWIGKPIAATAFMLGHGPESWHPDPEFFYQVGAGPMFDMGPYYLTTLVHVLGPIKRVTGSAQISFAKRTITSQPKYGKQIEVETATHIAGVMDFTGGAVATIITSFDVWHNKLPRIEIYGTEGTLSVPDPNTFGGPVQIRRFDMDRWMEMPLTHGFTENWRGLGVADMADAIIHERPHRAAGEVGLHVLEAMHGFHIASSEETHYHMQTTCVQPDSFPVGISQIQVRK